MVVVGWLVGGGFHIEQNVEMVKNGERSNGIQSAQEKSFVDKLKRNKV